MTLAAGARDRRARQARPASRPSASKVGRHPHGVPAVAGEPAGRPARLLPGRIGRRPEGQGRPRASDRHDAGQGRKQGEELRRGAGRALPAGRADSRLRRQGIDRVRGDRPPRQPRRIRRSARRTGADAALRRRRLHAQPPGRARLRHQDAAREPRRGSGQAGDGDGDVPRPSLRPPVAGDGRRPERHHARRRAQAVRVALRARSPGDRRRGRLSRRLRRGVREALRGAARQGAAAAEAAARARAQAATS